MLWFLTGYVRISFKGSKAKEFINMCHDEGISFKRMSVMLGSYFADVSASQIRQVLNISAKCEMDTKLQGRYGLFMKLWIYKRRIAFFAAFALGILMIYANSLFVSEIKITGNNYMTDAQLLTLLEKSGLECGTFIPGADTRRICHEVMTDCNTLSWIGVEISGTTAIVDVREKISRPEGFDADAPCNVVASGEGVITEAVSQTGKCVVKEGDYVRKGELLISGVYDSNEYAPVRFVHASGRVRARTEYRIDGVFSDTYIQYSLTEPKTKYSLRLFDNEFVFGSKIRDNYVNVESTEKIFQIFGKKYSSLGFTKSKYCEIISTECILEKSELELKAKEVLTARLELQLPDGAEIADTVSNVVWNDDGTVYVELIYKCIEDICEERSIDLSEE